jgi:hypothetical protein
VAAAFLASRAVLLVIVAFIEALALPWDRPAYSTAPILGGLTGHDAVYYLGIAADGYHAAPVSGPYTDWVFFPLFPLLVRVAAVLTLGDVAVAGVLVANLALLVGLGLVATYVREVAGRDAARRAAWLVAFAPGSVAFGLAYSDSLLLAASAGALLALRRGAWLTVAVLFALAALSRPPGILLGLPLLVGAWQARRRIGPHLLVLAAGPLAIAGFAAWQGATLGDPLAFIRGQAAWNLLPVTAGPPGGAAGDTPGWYIPWLVALLVVTLLGYTALLPRLWRSRLPRPAVLVALVAFLSVFLSGRLQSDARYLAAGWPFAALLATSGRRVFGAALAISVAGHVGYGLLNVSQLLAP